MTGPDILARPITGELSRTGHLLRADDELASLHSRAGGLNGGIIACPALFGLVQIVSRLQMRLARAVTVSDGADNLELWVEAEPAADNVRIAILSWQNKAERPLTAPSGMAWKAASDETLKLSFDASLRLVRATGPVGDIINHQDFGATAQDVIIRLLGADAAKHVRNINNFAAIGRLSARLSGAADVLLWGEPETSGDGKPTGYTLYISKAPSGTSVDIKKPSQLNPGALFGKNLAPVLRQPLSRIIANAETIGSELLGPVRDNYATYARDIANAARHLTALVEDLGDLEAVERPGFTTAPDRIELGDMARRVAGLLALKAADHSINLKVPDDTRQVNATAEFRRVLQIMLNLVTNAIRYSPDGTVVTVQISAEQNWSVISVSDQGSGVREADRERIFLKFERLGRTGDGGSGLGLYISRRLARFMGGDLTVGDAEGGGAIFTLRLPR
jgi:anti-sigma regulatory factor (Ser/Thr protein kinase)